MEHVKVLLQFVARSFYETRHIIILDAIIRHVVISDDELPQMVGIQKKELHKLCAKLREDRLIKIHARAEAKEGQQRPIQRTYYYIQYREAVDAIKWRIHKLGETFNDQMRNDVDRQGYVCPVCKRRYSTMEALSLQAEDLSGFVCSDCGNILQEDDDSDDLRISQERLARLMSQIRRIIDTLKKIDDAFIPDNDFESSMKVAVPTSIDVKDVQDTVGYAARGVNSNEFSIEIDLSGDSNEEDRNAAAAAKLAAAQQNALPSWIRDSTVGKKKFDDVDEMEEDDSKYSLLMSTSMMEEKAKIEAKNAEVTEGEPEADDVIRDYYKLLKEEEEEEDDDDEEEEEEEEGEGEGDDDDEFEEVAI
ncbi:TFIIE alpha subunit-domain-containing protein [Limtongia smithiae]|uniref:TFIIE alpha subunit-domain-containing protein n=1 Tax=Limtongia smithiae TaxID=1125753 RepID=UPI0034CF32DC